MATCHMQLRPLLGKPYDIIINQIKSNQGFWLQHSTIVTSITTYFLLFFTYWGLKNDWTIL